MTLFNVNTTLKDSQKCVCGLGLCCSRPFPVMFWIPLLMESPPLPWFPVPKSNQLWGTKEYLIWYEWYSLVEDLLVLGQMLDSVILEVSSNLDDSGILWNKKSPFCFKTCLPSQNLKKKNEFTLPEWKTK